MRPRTRTSHNDRGKDTLVTLGSVVGTPGAAQAAPGVHQSCSPHCKGTLRGQLQLACASLTRVGEHLLQFFHVGLLVLDPALQQDTQRRILGGQR